MAQMSDSILIAQDWQSLRLRTVSILRAHRISFKITSLHHTDLQKAVEVSLFIQTFHISYHKSGWRRPCIRIFLYKPLPVSVFEGGRPLQYDQNGLATSPISLQLLFKRYKYASKDTTLASVDIPCVRYC